MVFSGHDILVMIFAYLAHLTTRVDSVTSRAAVARVVPSTHVALTGTPLTVLSGISRTGCLKECLQSNCAAFNYGEGQCELLNVYLCEDIESLTPKTNFRYFDVETEDFVLTVDDYRTESACVTLNRCSPKCYAFTTTTPTTTTTTTTPAPTTTTTTTTTTPPPTTTTSTTTTLAATTTTAATTTQAATTTVGGPPGPGEIYSSCAVDTDCSGTTANSYCLIELTGVCTCIAAYSYHPATKSCIDTCPGSLGTTYSKTLTYYLMGHNILTGITSGITTIEGCMNACSADPSCLSIEFDPFNAVDNCFINDVTKAVGPDANFVFNPFFDYYQRDCA